MKKLALIMLTGITVFVLPNAQAHYYRGHSGAQIQHTYKGAENTTKERYFTLQNIDYYSDHLHSHVLWPISSLLSDFNATLSSRYHRDQHSIIAAHRKRDGYVCRVKFPNHASLGRTDGHGKCIVIMHDTPQYFDNYTLLHR